MKLLEIIKAALTKFSKINFANYAGIALMIFTTWQNADLISASMVLMLTGIVTLILKFSSSTKELVATGFSMDWTVYLSGLFGAVVGFLDSFVNTDILSSIFGDFTNIAIMIYMALTVIFRTGFTNQSVKTVV